MVDKADAEEAARQLDTALSASDSMAASQTTLATEANKNRGDSDEDADSKGPVNEESSSNVLFHPPAAHEEHSADDSAEEDSAIGFASSTVASNVVANEDDEALSTNEDGKKKRKKRNKKKKKRNQDGDSISEVSVNDQSVTEGGNTFMDDSQEMSRSGSRPARPTNSRKLASTGPDFTPLKEKIDDTFFDDQDSSEDEGMPDYKIGGYHPVHVGEILLDRYIIIQKLGWGHFSTVWLTKDLKYNSYVAIKVQKSAQHYLEAAYDEVEILDQVAKNWRCEGW